jgi:nicotinamide riboside kinase
MVRKNAFVVTIVGAESSGKTVLAKQLAAVLSCEWVPEFAREYLENLDRSYDFEDLEAIARGEWDLIVEKSKDHHSREENRSFHFK